MRITTLFLLVFIMTGCKRDNFNIIEVGSYQARNSYPYVNVDNEDDKKSQEMERDSIRKSRPQISTPEFEKAGLSKNGALLIDKFKNDDFTLEDQTGNKIEVKYLGDPKTGLTKLAFKKGALLKSIDVTNRRNGSAFSTFHADIIPGGYEEIITFTQDYFMNGDNFYVTVYEIQSGG